MVSFSTERNNRCKGIKLGYYLTAYIEVNAKWIKDLNIRTKTTKLLGKKGGKLYNTALGNDFLDMTLKHREQWCIQGHYKQSGKAPRNGRKHL